MAGTVAQKKILEELKRDLFSGEDATVMRALTRCKESGNASMVEPLIALYGSTRNATFKGEISEMLSSLKVSNSEEAFMNALENKELKHIRKDLLSFMWNSGVQPVDGVATITHIAVQSDYDVMLEALTLIESMDDLIPEEVLLESVAEVKQVLGESLKAENRTLLMEYLRVLEIKMAEGDEALTDE